MSRLQSELQRLYLLPAGAGASADTDADAAPGLVDAQGRVRALVLEVAAPASWELLSRVWRGVQAELELSAPAIAVSGTDGLQLWFSLVEPMALGQAQGFLDALRRRYLADVAPSRVRAWPQSGATQQPPVRHAPRVPAEQGASGNWSAYVAPDLAPVFGDTPWLDIPPSLDGQADLLSRLACITPAEFAAALQSLQVTGSGTQPPSPQAAWVATAVPGAGPLAAAPAAGSAAGSVEGWVSDPKQFLLQVMNDSTAPLALRVEAAKALLPHAAG